MNFQIITVVVKAKRANNCVYLIFMELLNPMDSQTIPSETCNQFTRECQKTDSNEACCKNVVCYLQMAGHFYAYNWGQEYSENQKNEYFISTTACMDRDHHRLDRSCVKWMYQFYHVTKQSEGWRKCSDFDYSRHSRGET